MSHVTTQAETTQECWPSLAKLSTCENACPIHIDIPRYIRAIAVGDFKGALQIIREKTPLPVACGRVCHHPCEEACLRGKIDQPLAIEALKRFVTDYALQSGVEKPSPCEKIWDQNVAIIGSGPAGLAAAHDLIRRGYGVTVFEALSVAGGMLAVGIPEFVLPKKLLQADIDYIQSLGVEIKLNAPIGKDLSVEDLSERYDAVFVAAGASESGRLNMPGMDSGNVLHALPFLQDANLGKATKMQGKVVVIGGGNVAVDCARVALRLGASEVTMACLECREEMPAFEWEIEGALEEGVNINPSLAPRDVTLQGQKATGVNCCQVESIDFDSEGRIQPKLIESNKQLLAADTVIIAIGQRTDLSALSKSGRLELSGNGTLKVDSQTLATNLPGVFGGGDAVTARGTVTESIAIGQKAALSIHRYLRELEPKEEAEPEVVEVADEKLPQFVEKRDRQTMPAVKAEERVKSFVEVQTGFDREAAVSEAGRCLNCPMCGNCVFDRMQMCYETASRLL